MEYRTLGRSGCSVSSLALGSMTFGYETDEPGAHAQLDAFIEAGGNLVDTADVYALGRSETYIGTWLAGRPADVRDGVILATKARYPMYGQGGANNLGLSRRHLQDALDRSLRRLGVDCIDLYQVHAWDPHTPLEETLTTLDDAVRAGKIRYVGLSNFTGWQVQKAACTARAQRQIPPVTLQAHYSLLSREVEWEVIPSCLDVPLGLISWSPLLGGWLTGKYRRGEAPGPSTRIGDNPKRGMEAYDQRSTAQRTWDIVDTVRRVADGRGATMAQVALAWVAGRPGVTSVIVGARTVEQLRENVGAADLALSPEELTLLDKVSDPAPGDYPYGRFGVEQQIRKLEGGR